MREEAESDYKIGKNNSKRLSKIFDLKWILIALPVIYITFVLLFPLFSLLKLSLFDKNGFTLSYLSGFFTRGVYLQVLLHTFMTSFTVTIGCLLLGYPVSYLLVSSESKKWKNIIIQIIVISYWISLLIRSFSWIVLLGTNGVINDILINLGIIQTPLKLLYNMIGVQIGMIHILLPYMILILYSAMTRIDLTLLKAAQGMGASPWKAFLHTFFPLSLVGVLSGSIAVFVLGVGYYITPELLGGAQNMMIAQLIAEQINMVLNWNFAAAISLILLITTLILLILVGLVNKKFLLPKGLD